MDAEYGQMVRAQLIRRQRALGAARDERLAALATRADAEAYIERARAATVAAFSPGLPTERTPLNPVVVGEAAQHAAGFRVENVRFEATPANFVTANLYLPDGASAATPAPAVLQPLGHSATAKAATGYQEASQRLAVSGFAVLSYDPINQGERDQYYCGVCNAPIDADPTPSRAGLPATHHLRAACTCAHNMMGKQLELLDDFFGAWRAWDGMRALDYLLSREEIDTDHLGITGTRSPTHPTTLPHPASLSLCHSPRPSRSRAAVDPPRRELWRGDDDLLDLGGRPPLHHGRALLLHHHIREEPGERNPGRR